jgi:hypothetical protein
MANLGSYFRLRHEMDPIEYAADLAREFGCNMIHVEPYTAGGPILVMTRTHGVGARFRRYLPERFIKAGRED